MRACNKGTRESAAGGPREQVNNDVNPRETHTLTRSQRLKTELIAAAAAPTISAICRTMTWKVEGEQLFDEILRSGRVPIVAVWHGRILPVIWHFRNRGVVVMASANFD